MRSNRGFSLIEVVVAVAILSIASVAILRYFSQSLYSIGRSAASLDYGDALKYYYSEAVRLYPTADEDEMEYETDRFRFRFSFADAPFVQDEDYPVIPGVEMKQVTVTVLMKPDDREIYNQVTYHVMPVKALP